MATASLISVQEYLATSYSPDCDYVDGTVLERNVGEKDHGKLQLALAAWFYSRRKKLGVYPFVEQRVQVSRTRFRVPDVCVTVGEPDEQIFTAPPLICVEILSPEDRLAEMQQRVSDYLAMGVPYVWILNPRTREAFRCTSDGLQRVAELHTDDPAIVVPLADLFED